MHLLALAFLAAGCTDKQPGGDDTDTGQVSSEDTASETGTAGGDDTGSTPTGSGACFNEGQEQIVLDGALSFSTLDEALANASDGSVLLVCDGSYDAGVTLDFPVTLRSAGGPDGAILRGVGGSVLRVASSGVVIDGLTLSGGLGSAWDIGEAEPVLAGGAVFAEDVETLTLTNNVLIGNSATYGGGVAAVRVGLLTASGNSFSTNIAEVAGGGLYAQQGETVMTSDALFGNSAEFGGGLSIEGGGLTLMSVSLESNDGRVRGGGLMVLSEATLSVSGGVIRGNTSAFGGGVTAQGAAAVSLDGDLLLDGNVAGTWGGGLYLENVPEVSLSDIQLQANAAGFGGGGFMNGCDVEASGLSVAGNEAERSGGGLYALESSLSIADSTISDNALTLPAEEGAPCGGGLVGQVADISVSDSALSGNTSTLYGGGVCLVGGSLTMSGGSIRDGDAGEWGGGLWLQSGAAASLSGVSVTDNTAAFGGGGAYLYIDGATLVSDASSWGSETSDNAPDDVNVWGTAYDAYGDDESFTCDVGGGVCG